jgi:SAM-dependent methyltransferase
VNADDATGGQGRWDDLIEVESQAEYQRLRLLEERFDPFSTRLLERLQVRQGTRCLEVGAGAGSIASWLAGRAGAGHVVATDLRTGLLTPLTAAGVRVLRHDVTTDEQPGEFDLIHARAVLDHIRERDTALRRLVSWLAPGGRLLIECAASQPTTITNPATRRARIAMHAMLADTLGYDHGWALNLPEPLHQAGLTAVGMERFTPAQRGGAEAELITTTLRTMAPRMIANDLITETALAEAYAAYADPMYVDHATLVIGAGGTKP